LELWSEGERGEEGTQEAGTWVFRKKNSNLKKTGSNRKRTNNVCVKELGFKKGVPVSKKISPRQKKETRGKVKPPKREDPSLPVKRWGKLPAQKSPISRNESTLVPGLA